MNKSLRKQPQRIACTIAATNYFAQVEVLAQSFKKHHPDIPFFVLLLDDFKGQEYKKIRSVSFPVVTLPEMEKGYRHDKDRISLRYLLFQYNVLEAATAIKPFFLEYLLNQHECDEVLFLDPDLYLTEPLGDIWPSSTDSSISLTPHLLELGGFQRAVKSERGVLQSGIFNLGFVAVRRTENALTFLHWWSQRLQRLCLARVHEGLFTDQRWVDLALGAMDDVRILRDPGLNIAHWNMHERILSERNGKYFANGQPLRLFHFSGFLPDRPTQLSKHRKDVFVDEHSPLGRLCKEYREQLLKYDYNRFSKVRCALNYWNNGIKIPSLARELALEKQMWIRFPDPFDAATVDCFFDWLVRPADRNLPRIFFKIWEMREDLRRAFPPGQEHDNRLSEWVYKYGVNETDFEPRMKKIIRFVLDQQKAPHFAGKQGWLSL